MTPLPRWTRSLPALAAFAYLVGYGFHSIDGVADADTLWVGNLSWPYLVVPALACLGEAGPTRRVLRPAVASVAMVLGFYDAVGLFTVSAETTGLPADATWLEIERVAWVSYVEHLVLGIPGGIPWISVALLTGGLLGAAYHLGVGQDRRRAGAFWAALAFLGLVEPVFHFAPAFAGLPFAGYRFDGYGRAVAAVEVLLALALLGTAVAHLAAPRRTAGP